MHWLAVKLFGNGHGMAQPFFDGRFFWLVDTTHGRKHASKGRLYTFGHGLGAQLSSFEWRSPKPGERRRLAGVEFRVFNVSRGWVRDPFGWGFCLFPLMWRVSWAMCRMPADLDAQNECIRSLEKRLGRYDSDYSEAA